MTTPADLDALLREAGGRCQCEGQCGHTHAWTAEAPAQRCRAPHGCEIQRKLDHQSFWMLAGSDTLPLAFPEFFREVIETVSLHPVKLRVGARVVCAFCLQAMRARKKGQAP